MTLRTLLMVGTAVVLTGCSTRYDVQGARDLPNQGDAFARELQQQYADLAGSELSEGDYTDTEFFVGKSRSAAETGGNVGPQEIPGRALPAGTTEELSAARARLTGLLGNSDAREAAPAALARAQAKFDCWMQEQEENTQPEQIAACRSAFLSAMDEAEAALTPPAPEPVAAATPDNGFELYFDFDSAALTGEARAEIDRVLDAMIQLNPSRIVVIGHTDTSGTDAYNDALALKRARSVSKELQKIGLSADMIDVRAVGEKDLKIDTPDGTKNQMNRRVRILLQ